jgi:CheY-like chemotaxis protein
MATILLAEDNEVVGELIRERLEMNGFSVLAAANGLEALELARQQAPDLILLDMSMPLMDGWATAQALEEHPATRDIPVIAVTAHALPGDREKALQAGCDAYVSKPVDFNELLRKIKRLLEEAGNQP